MGNRVFVVLLSEHSATDATERNRDSLILSLLFPYISILSFRERKDLFQGLPIVI